MTSGAGKVSRIGTSALRRFFGLTRRDQYRLLVALPLVVAVRLGLWFVPFRRVRATVDRVAHPRPGAPDPTPGDADLIVWAVRAAARRVPGTSCLTRALAAEVLLAKAGHPVRIRLGVAKDDRGRIEAHAWVESNGRVVLGDEELDRYVLLQPSTQQPSTQHAAPADP